MYNPATYEWPWLNCYICRSNFSFWDRIHGIYFGNWVWRKTIKKVYL